MKTLDEIKGEMLLSPEEKQKAWHDACHNNTELVQLSYPDVLIKAQHEKDMNTVISKGEVCPECKGKRESMFLIPRPAPCPAPNKVTCPNCNGTGTVDITVRDAINKVKGDG